MAELQVPELQADPFREHYRSLVLGSLLRAAELRSERERASGHRLRARRAERDEASLRQQAGAARTVPRPRRFAPELRPSIRLAWLATLLLLALDLIAFGIHSWTTSVLDVGLIVLTLAWFRVSLDDLVPAIETTPEQLELFG